MLSSVHSTLTSTMHCRLAEVQSAIAGLFEAVWAVLAFNRLLNRQSEAVSISESGDLDQIVYGGIIFDIQGLPKGDRLIQLIQLIRPNPRGKCRECPGLT